MWEGERIGTRTVTVEKEREGEREREREREREGGREREACSGGDPKKKRVVEEMM